MSADARRPIGKSSAVSATMNRLIPSTPTTYRTPNSPIQRWFSTNWYPWVPTLNCTSRHSASPPVAAVVR
jgi:hypothetical protein